MTTCSSSASSSLSTIATSPLECLPKAELTPSGLLKLDMADGEVELWSCHDPNNSNNKLELRSNAMEPLSSHSKYTSRVSVSSVVLTTHRLVLSSSHFLHLSNIHAVDSTTSNMTLFSTTSQITLSTYSLGDLILVVPKKEFPSLYSNIQKALERRAWETLSRLQDAKSKTVVSKRRVGVDAIMASQQKKHDRASQLTEQAFEGDVETLLSEATELIAIIHKYAATLSQTKNDSEQTAATAATAQLADMLQDMGMASATTSFLPRSSKTNHYQLARQLADFIHAKSSPGNKETMSIIMTLEDVYCVYNRARASNLISPLELLQAVECFKDLPSLQLQLKTFPSGVRVIQHVANDNSILEQLQTMAKEQTYLTALQVAREFHISTILSQETLIEAEQNGLLCRDVTLETTRFYPNLFLDSNFTTWKQQQQQQQ